MSDAIREYWNSRALESQGQRRATTDDVHLRDLEVTATIATLRELLPAGATLLDAGCGDGYATLAIASALPGIRAVGVDFSAQMISLANGHLSRSPALAGRVSFTEGDVTRLDLVAPGQQFDVVLTERCLINLGSYDRQRTAFSQIARRLVPGSHYIAVENFVEGQENMNAARASLGLPPIEIRWHNTFFTEETFTAAARPHFEVVAFRDFASSYYFATRIVYSKICQTRGEPPDYQNEIHRLAVNLPSSGRFSPIRMAVLRRLRRDVDQASGPP
jgi:ubiquinone/menaquinone biosynthesis C-methylase UbiE